MKPLVDIHLNFLVVKQNCVRIFYSGVSDAVESDYIIIYNCKSMSELLTYLSSGWAFTQC